MTIMIIPSCITIKARIFRKSSHEGKQRSGDKCPRVQNYGVNTFLARVVPYALVFTQFACANQLLQKFNELVNGT